MTTTIGLGRAAPALRGASSEGAHVVTDAPVDPGEGPALSSLVSTNQTVADGEACPTPRRGFRLLNLDTRELRPVGCNRQSCPGCGPYLGWRRGLAIGWARPERQLELTLVGDDWQTIRERVKRVRYDLVAAGVAVEWAWHVEPNPRGTGHHVHAFQHGDYIPQDLLSDVADSNGMGFRAFIQAWRPHQSNEAASYGLKGAGYGLKGAARAEALSGYLEANGGRLSHASRGYFRGIGVRDAEKRAMMVLRGGESPWVVVTDEELHRSFASAGEVRRAGEVPLRGDAPRAAV